MATTDNNKIVQSLWFGNEISTLERLCLESFIQNGHEFHLYAYQHIEQLPEGVTLMDANNIIPTEKIFTQDRRSLAGISDWFRYQLLYEKGGWWVDMDVVCLKYLDIKDEYCFTTDLNPETIKDPIANSIIKSPKDAEYLADLLDYIELHPEPPAGRSEYGTELFNAVLKNYDCQKFVQTAELFYPIAWHEVYKYVSKQLPFITPETFTAPLFGSFWTEGKLNREATYHPDSVFEQLKMRYNIQVLQDDIAV